MTFVERWKGRWGIGLLSAFVWLAVATSVQAVTWVVEPKGPLSLQQTVSRATDGDTVVIRGGEYPGPLFINKSLVLRGEDWPVIDGAGRGTVLAVQASDVRVEGLVIRGSGDSLDQENTGIAVEAPRVEVVGNRFEDVLFGVYLRRAPEGVVRGNSIHGKLLDLPRRGDAVRVWYSDGTRILDNEIFDSRDVVLWYSSDLTVEGNTVRYGRYGLHFMYCDDARIEGNVLADNSVGAFLMYSRRLRLLGNVLVGNRGPSGYGIGLKDMDDAVLEGNLFLTNRVGVFLDNTPREMASESRVEGNYFAGNAFAIRMLPNVRRSHFVGNSFDQNLEQVSIAGGGGDPESNRWRDNFWSDYVGFDAEGDGQGDLPHRSVRLFEALSDRHPNLRLFLHSPATRAMDLAARAFPLVRPQPKLTDPTPRMSASVPVAALALAEGTLSEASVAAGRGSWISLMTGLVAGLAILLFQGARQRHPPGNGRERSARMVSESSLEVAKVDAPVVVEAQGLGRGFGDRVALEDVSFSLRRGESVAIWGANGAGKTTLLRALLGVMPFEGSVRVAGHDPWRRGKSARGQIGFVPQEVTLQGDLELVETMAFFARLRGTSGDAIPELVRRLGLENECGKRVRELSGGLRQRLGLAVALLDDPPILLLDEPTANLDLEARREFLDLLLDLENQGKTLIFTSHRLEEVRALAHRVLHLDRGRLVADTTPRQLMARCRRETEIWLQVAADDRPRTLETIATMELESRVLGDEVVVSLPSDQKMKLLSSLRDAEIAVRDFDLGGEVHPSRAQALRGEEDR